MKMICNILDTNRETNREMLDMIDPPVLDEKIREFIEKQKVKNQLEIKNKKLKNALGLIAYSENTENNE